MANLPKAGVEYFTWTFSGLPEGATVEVRIGDAWHALTMAGAVGTLLLRGPDAPEVEGSVLVSASADSIAIRVTDSPEIIIRDRGAITLVD